MMMQTVPDIGSFNENGFAIMDDVYSDDEIDALAACIQQAESSRDTFRRSANLFAIRQFLKEIPETIPVIFNQKLRKIMADHVGADYFPVKSIYFDKPADSNWFVAYHQDLTISVNKKTNLEGYSLWTVKQGQFAVQPPVDLLENIVTLRIHLDDTDEDNGALNVLKGSHLKGICRPETIDIRTETEHICRVKKGGLMLMKPLLMHSSHRSSSERRRRVIHIEFSNTELPAELLWAERLDV
jgi:ectoine hydroxylase-related dioxygenase (phytanoyl-CoA dioxygenase family)